jgi:DNA-directed RNA polymerase subunit D
MKVNVEKKWENRIQFSLTEATVAFANALRRYASMRVPVLVMDKITIYENTTSLFDEYLAHRIGMIPVTTPEKLPKEIDITFYLDEAGPKTVYSKDLKCSDKDIATGRETIPIITLTENQKLKLEGKLKLGIGHTHAKYQSGVAAYEIAGEKIIFMVESLFQMTPKELMLRACDEIESDLGELAKELKKAAK